jgi:hypothetical protein
MPHAVASAGGLPFATPKLESTCIFAMVIFGPTTKFDSCQYLQLKRAAEKEAADKEGKHFLFMSGLLI